jgi:hypothetical protein
MTDNTEKTLALFAMEVMNAENFVDAREVVNKIILAAAYDNDLVTETLARVNAKIDWSASIERVQSNMSELN